MTGDPRMSICSRESGGGRNATQTPGTSTDATGTVPPAQFHQRCNGHVKDGCCRYYRYWNDRSRRVYAPKEPVREPCQNITRKFRTALNAKHSRNLAMNLTSTKNPLDRRNLPLFSSERPVLSVPARHSLQRTHDAMPVGMNAAEADAGKTTTRLR